MDRDSHDITRPLSEDALPELILNILLKVYDYVDGGRRVVIKRSVRAGDNERHG